MKVLARVLMGLGAFLIIAGILAVAWAPGVVKKIPLNVDTKTVYSGTAAKLDSSTGAFDQKPVYALTYTKADSTRSDSKTVIFQVNSCAVFDTGGAQVCVNGNDPDLITASQDILALDRVTAEGTKSAKLPADAIFPQGLYDKFPFDAQKKSYPFWDGTLGKSVPIQYQGTESLFGLNTYKYSYTVKDAKVDVAADTPGIYDNVVTTWVDPKTGSIVKSGQDQQLYLADGTEIADVNVVQTDDSVKDAVNDAKSSGKQLTLLLTIVPIVGFVGGILCLLGGLAMVLRERREGGQRVATKEKVGAGV